MKLIVHHCTSTGIVTNIVAIEKYKAPTSGVIAAIDPGKVNFAIRVEEVVDRKWQRTVLFDKRVIGTTLAGWNAACYDYKPFLLQTTVIIIERQIKKSDLLVRINQHFVSFISQLPRESGRDITIVEVHTKFKNRFLDHHYPNNNKKYKKLSEDYGWKWYVSFDQKQEDRRNVADLAITEKLDDLTDTIIMIRTLINYCM